MKCEQLHHVHSYWIHFLRCSILECHEKCGGKINKKFFNMTQKHPILSDRMHEGFDCAMVPDLRSALYFNSENFKPIFFKICPLIHRCR